MKRHFIYTTAILCLLTAYSNTPKSTTADNLTIIDLETALKSPEGEMKLSDLYTSVHYIPLETNDSSLVRSHPSVLMTDEKSSSLPSGMASYAIALTARPDSSSPVPDTAISSAC